MINKIDLPHANIEMAKKQMEDILAIPAELAILASAKEGIGIDDILEAIVQRIPAPKATGRRRCRRWDLIRILTLTRGW